MQAKQHHANDHELPVILNLIQTAFAYMDDRIDPPSSMHKLTLADIARLCDEGEVWSIGNPIQACMALQAKPQTLYLGRLAVAEHCQRQGLGRQLVKLAVSRARELRLPTLEIYTRVELTENHAFFMSLGFCIKEQRSHAGYDKPTYMVMQKPIS